MSWVGWGRGDFLLGEMRNRISAVSVSRESPQTAQFQENGMAQAVSVSSTNWNICPGLSSEKKFITDCFIGNSGLLGVVCDKIFRVQR